MFAVAVFFSSGIFDPAQLKEKAIRNLDACSKKMSLRREVFGGV